MLPTIFRWLRRLVVTVVVLFVVVVVGGGGYYATQLMPAQGPFPIRYDVEAVTAAGGGLVLDASEADPSDIADVRTAGVFGYLHDDGYARLVGTPTAATPTGARREVSVLRGDAPVAGTRGEVQATAFPDDPTVLGVEVAEIEIEGPLGAYPAWQFAGTSDTVVVFVHGRGATRAESLRGVEIVTGLGLPALVVSYRNDGAAPNTDDGYGHFGGTEWQDLEPAVEHARTQMGARRIVLFGHSQGGSIVASWFRNTDDTSDVAGLVLDSPLLSIQQTLVLQAEDRNIPGPLIAPILTVTKAIADVVGDIDFAALEHVEDADELTVPILLFHGRDDGDVPFSTSAQLAVARSQLVTFVPYDGRHVRGWNVAQETYVGAVQDFLAGLG